MASGLNAAPYTRDILRLATSISHLGRLDDAHGRCELRSRTCGARMAADYRIVGGKVDALGLEVEACAFGQAAAALMSEHAIGCDRTKAKEAVESLSCWLRGEAGEPGSWPGLERLAPARHLTGRHDAMLLPFRLLTAIFEDSQ